VDRLPPPVRGVLWMVLAALCFAVTIGLVKALAGTYTVFEMMLHRQLLGTLFMMPWLLRMGFDGLRTTRFRWHIARSFVTYAAIYASYLSAVLIPLADSTALQFILPLFTILFATLFLHEWVGRHRWVATLVGFAGALVILRPGFAEINAGMLVAIAAAALFGASDVSTRYLARDEGTNSVVLWGYLPQLPLAAIAALPDLKTPATNDIGLIIAFALAAFLAQWFLTKAFATADATLVSPVLFVRLPFVTVIGYVFFAEHPDPWTWIGAAIIFAGTWYAARHEAAHHRAAERGGAT